MSGEFVDLLLDRERKRDAEVAELKAEIRRLKEPPTITIIHPVEDSPFPDAYRMLVEWQGYRHATMLHTHAFAEIDYREHCERSALDAVVRAHVEALLPSAYRIEETYDEHYRRVRS